MPWCAMYSVHAFAMITPRAISEQSTSGYIIHPPSANRVNSRYWVSKRRSLLHRALRPYTLALRLRGVQARGWATALSAGMSSDMEAAIRYGATHVRVGSAILGKRPPLR